MQKLIVKNNLSNLALQFVLLYSAALKQSFEANMDAITNRLEVNTTRGNYDYKATYKNNM